MHKFTLIASKRKKYTQIFGSFQFCTYFCTEKTEKDAIMEADITRERALEACKKALTHKKEATQKFQLWLQEKGINGKVVTL